ncbi:hypothetical protein NL676_017006 [Syzygium grande]|nr:hypothetical protein NL676_017006 [Syzygium grande]
MQCQSLRGISESFYRHSGAIPQDSFVHTTGPTLTHLLCLLKLLVAPFSLRKVNLLRRTSSGHWRDSLGLQLPNLEAELAKCREAPAATWLDVIALIKLQPAGLSSRQIVDDREASGECLSKSGGSSVRSRVENLKTMVLRSSETPHSSENKLRLLEFIFSQTGTGGRKKNFLLQSPSPRLTPTPAIKVNYKARANHLHLVEEELEQEV